MEGVDPVELAVKWGVKYRECQVRHQKLIDYIDEKNRSHDG